MYIPSVRTYTHFLLGIYHVIKLLGHRMCPESAFADTSKQYHKVTVPILCVSFCTKIDAKNDLRG